MAKPVFVTGQQIGLLGGPLYTAYKVLGTVVLAEQAKGEAVFWLETNDADFAEINHFSYLDSENKLKTLRWDVKTGGLSCGRVPVDNSLIDILNVFFDDLTPTEWTDSLRELALSCYRPGEELGKAAFRLASALFNSVGIRIFDPSDNEFLREVRPILEREIIETPPGEQCNAFLRIKGKRLALFRTESGVRFRDGTPATLSAGTLLPNLKTRNVCQDSFFHTDTYVAGPGEMAYIEKLDPWYERHGVKKARIQPRMSAILLEPRSRRLLERASLTVDEVTGRNRETLLNLIRNRESGIDFRKLEHSTTEKTQHYLRELAERGLDILPIRKVLNPAVKAAIGKKRAAIHRGLRGELADAGELSDRLLPFGMPQERVFNLFYFMNRYGGLNFVQWLLAQYRFEPCILEVNNA